jgi:hypothetical protein
LTISFTVDDTPGEPNDPPIVDAGPDQSLADTATSTTLAGTATDDDGAIDSTLWTQTAGP